MITNFLFLPLFEISIVAIKGLVLSNVRFLNTLTELKLNFFLKKLFN